MTWQFRFPVFVMLNWVAIHRFVLPAVDAQVGLPIPIQIERSQGNPVWERLLKDRGRYIFPTPDDFPVAIRS